MIVKLLKHTPEPEKTCAMAARLCYSNSSIDELEEKITESQVADRLTKVIASGHHSVLEHASFTFGIEGVSRALLAQLTRHRIASFSVQSQRYVKFKGSLEMVVPPIISKDAALNAQFSEAIASLKSVYDRFLESGVPAEDARYILPNAATTKIILTMNARELRHFFALRCCNRAQWEIKEMACRMLNLAKQSAPILFANAGPDCVGSGCQEEKPCGHPWPKSK